MPDWKKDVESVDVEAVNEGKGGSDYRVVPEGWYDFEKEGCSNVTFETGSACFEIYLSVKGGDYDGVVLHHRMWYTGKTREKQENAEVKVQSQMALLGVVLPEGDVSFDDMADLIDQSSGYESLRGKVDVETYEGNEYSSVGFLDVRPVTSMKAADGVQKVVDAKADPF